MISPLPSPRAGDHRRTDRRGESRASSRPASRRKPLSRQAAERTRRSLHARRPTGWLPRPRTVLDDLRRLRAGRRDSRHGTAAGARSRGARQRQSWRPSTRRCRRSRRRRPAALPDVQARLVDALQAGPRPVRAAAAVRVGCAPVGPGGSAGLRAGRTGPPSGAAVSGTPRRIAVGAHRRPRERQAVLSSGCVDRRAAQATTAVALAAGTQRAASATSTRGATSTRSAGRIACGAAEAAGDTRRSGRRCRSGRAAAETVQGRPRVAGRGHGASGVRRRRRRDGPPLAASNRGRQGPGRAGGARRHGGLRRRLHRVRQLVILDHGGQTFSLYGNLGADLGVQG